MDPEDDLAGLKVSSFYLPSQLIVRLGVSYCLKITFSFPHKNLGGLSPKRSVFCYLQKQVGSANCPELFSLQRGFPWPALGLSREQPRGAWHCRLPRRGPISLERALPASWPLGLWDTSGWLAGRNSQLLSSWRLTPCPVGALTWPPTSPPSSAAHARRLSGPGGLCLRRPRQVLGLQFSRPCSHFYSFPTFQECDEISDCHGLLSHLCPCAHLVFIPSLFLW